MRVKTGQDVLEYEILEEQAATIGRLGRELRQALETLDAFKRAAGRTMSNDRREVERKRLVDAAAYALWNFVVQRDCAGLRFTDRILEDYAVPGEVRLRMGAARRPA
jgi:hypothetical protein